MPPDSDNPGLQQDETASRIEAVVHFDESFGFKQLATLRGIDAEIGEEAVDDGDGWKHGHAKLCRFRPLQNLIRRIDRDARVA